MGVAVSELVVVVVSGIGVDPIHPKIINPTSNPP